MKPAAETKMRMSSFVTWFAQCKSVRNVESSVAVQGPRQHMVSAQFSAIPSAILTGVIIALQNCGPPLIVPPSAVITNGFLSPSNSVTLHGAMLAASGSNMAWLLKKDYATRFALERRTRGEVCFVSCCSGTGIRAILIWLTDRPEENHVTKKTNSFDLCHECKRAAFSRTVFCATAFNGTGVCKKALAARFANTVKPFGRWMRFANTGAFAGTVLSPVRRIRVREKFAVAYRTVTFNLSRLFGFADVATCSRTILAIASCNSACKYGKCSATRLARDNKCVRLDWHFGLPIRVCGVMPRAVDAAPRRFYTTKHIASCAWIATS